MVVVCNKCSQIRKVEKEVERKKRNREYKQLKSELVFKVVVSILKVLLFGLFMFLTFYLMKGNTSFLDEAHQFFHGLKHLIGFNI